MFKYLKSVTGSRKFRGIMMENNSEIQNNLGGLATDGIPHTDRIRYTSQVFLFAIRIHFQSV